MYDPNCKDYIQCINYWRLTVSNGVFKKKETDAVPIDYVQISGRDGTGLTKFMLGVEDAEKVILLLREQIDKIKKALA